MLELGVLLISISIILFVLWYNENSVASQVETFENYYLRACPSGYKTFYDSNGDVMCCDGEIIANKCAGNRQCSLSGKGQNCVDFLLEEYAAKAKTQCSSSMPNYFEDGGQNLKGCTSGPLNSTLTGPKSFNQPSCKIYSSWNENQNQKDSCFNQQLLDRAQCFGNNCTKTIVQPIAGKPVLVGIGFTDSMGVHRMAYTQESLEMFLDATNPSWRNQGLDLSKNIIVAEVAKAYYIDRTMEQSQIQF